MIMYEITSSGVDVSELDPEFLSLILINEQMSRY